MLITVFFSALSQAEKLPLVIGVENLLPHSGHEEIDGEGYANIIVREVFKDYSIKFEAAPYARLKRNLVSGKIDIMLLCVPFNFTLKDKVIFPQQPILQSAQVFFVRKDFPWRYHRDQSHSKVLLGLTSGLDYHELEWLLGETKLNYYIEGEQHIARALNLMRNNKLNVYYEDRAAVMFTAKKLNMVDEIMEAGAVLPPVDLFLGIGSHRSDAKQLAALFDSEIERLRQQDFIANAVNKVQ